MKYNEWMKWYANNFYRIYSFYPMSFWKFVKSTEFDKMIKDKTASESLSEDLGSKRKSKTYNKDWGARKSLSKFNSEYARRIVQFYSCFGDWILDPFAGRTRKKICEFLGRKYLGFEINKKYITEDGIINDDCINLPKHTSRRFDMLFTCPPYWNMEIYSEDIEGDLSRAVSYPDFLEKFGKRLKCSLNFVKRDGVVVIVLSDFRKQNKYMPFHNDTINIMRQLGWFLYDLIVLEMNPAARNCYYGQAATKRRMLLCHEFALVFAKNNNIEKRKRNEDRKLKHKFRKVGLFKQQ